MDTPQTYNTDVGFHFKSLADALAELREAFTPEQDKRREQESNLRDDPKPPSSG